MMYFVVGGDSAVDSRAGRAADDPDLLCCYQDHRKAQLNKLIWLSLSFFFSPLRKFERSGQAQLCQVALWASACMYLHAIQSECLQTQRSDGRTGLARTHSDNRDRTPNVAQTHPELRALGGKFLICTELYTEFLEMGLKTFNSTTIYGNRNHQKSCQFTSKVCTLASGRFCLFGNTADAQNVGWKQVCRIQHSADKSDELQSIN